MTRLQRKRLLLVSLVLLVAVVTSSLILTALQNQINFYYTPTSLLQEKISVDHTIRLGGIVEVGSLQYAQHGLKSSFAVTDGENKVFVRYDGVFPNLFKEGKGVVVQGLLRAGGVFDASEVLAKHDENYKPPHVA